MLSSWQKDFAGVMKLSILSREDDPEISGWAWCNHAGPNKREAGGSEERLEGATPLAVKMARGAMSQEMQAASWSGKGKEPRRAAGRDTALLTHWF